MASLFAPLMWLQNHFPLKLCLHEVLNQTLFLPLTLFHSEALCSLISTRPILHEASSQFASAALIHPAADWQESLALMAVLTDLRSSVLRLREPLLMTLGRLQDPSPEKKQFQGLINSYFFLKFQHISKRSGNKNEENHEIKLSPWSTKFLQLTL